MKRSTATRSSQSSVASSRMRRATGAQSGSTVAPSGQAVDAARLGEQVGGADHHLARDAAPVRALATDEPVLDPDHRQAGLGQPAGDLLTADAQPDDDRIHRFDHAPSIPPVRAPR